jgi:predicted dehydrogenase
VATLTLLFRQALLATIHLNYVQLPERHEYEVVGDRGTAILDANEGTLRISCRGTGQVKTEILKVDRDETYRAEHDAYLLAIEGKRKAETPPEAGLVSVAVCEAAIESWKTGQIIEMKL